MKRVLNLLLLGFLFTAGCSNPSTSPSASGWVKATGGAFKSGGRYGHSGTVFNNAMWVVGGVSSDASASVTTYYPEVWTSTNGSSWSEAVTTAPFGGRYGSQVLSYNGQMWLIGGNKGGTLQNDVWNSADGITWNLVPPNGPRFAAREDFGAIVFNNAMWVIGGYTGSSKNDVWTSTDGALWTQVATVGIFPGRWGFSTVIYNNLLWVFGGAFGGNNPSGGYGDSWSSPDGVTWTKVSPAPLIGNLYYSQPVVMNSQVWLVAGEDLTWGPRRWILATSDGISWQSYDPNFPERFYHLGLVFNNQAWVIGGMDNIMTRTYYNDVWHSP